MNVNIFFFLASNPFLDAYTQSDLLGKIIFISLYALSIVSWIVLIYKIWETTQAKKQSALFYEIFQLQKQNLLSLETPFSHKTANNNPFYDLYTVLKKQTIELLQKNKQVKENELVNATPHLSSADIDYVGSYLSFQVSKQVKGLEKNLFILATIVSLAPFLGLLGTVWGILITFSELQSQTAAGGTHQMVLGGLSLALATTVIGLIDAIPALVGYNYLKNSIKDFAIDLDGFSSEALALVELQYRKVD